MSVVVTQRNERPWVTVGPLVMCARRFFSKAMVAPARPSIEKPSNTWLMLGDAQDGRILDPREDVELGTPGRPRPSRCRR